jgi:hypothetical protein
MVRIQIEVTEEQREALHRIAEKEGVSVSEVVRRSLDLYAGGHVAEASEDDLWRRSLAAVGRFRSGRSDVSERHDDYLADACAER